MYTLFVILLFFAANTSYAIEDSSLKKRLVQKIHAHCVPGSFAHQALNYLKKTEILFDEKVYLHSNAILAIESAQKDNGYVFLSLSKNILPALKFYEIYGIDSVIQTKQEICLFQHKKAIERKIPIQQIASSPEKLKRMAKKKSRIKMIEVPAGMEEACELLCSGQFPLSTAVLAPKIAGSVYKNLTVSPSSVFLGEKNVVSTFALVKLKKRKTAISESQAKLEFQYIAKKVKKNLTGLHSNYQVLHFEKENNFSLTLEPSQS